MGAKITSVEGNRQKLDGGAMFGNAPKPLWERWIAADDRNRIDLACRCMLLEVDGRKILCETGIGAFFEPKMADRFGVQSPERHLLRENLQDLNIDESDIDICILSHLHFDHAGGLLPTYADIEAGKTDLLFPNAKYVTSKAAWDRAVEPHSRDKASFIPLLIEQLKNSGRLVLIDEADGKHDLGDRFGFYFSHGHTPGQMHTVFRGDQKSVVFCGDLIPGAPWAHLPITMGYDRYPEMLIEEKQRLYQKMDGIDWLAFYTHDPHVCASEVHHNGKKYQAENTIETMNAMAI